jgi:hypothetical protein
VPTPVPIPEETSLTLESAPLLTGDQEASPSYALAMVNDSISHCERYRSTNHDTRWKTNDALYFGYFPTRFWEGTQIPRASVGLPLTFDQIHAVLPFVFSSLFGSQGDYFQVEPIAPQSTLQDALAQKANLTYALDHPTDDFGGSAVNELKMAIRQALIYGNGGVFIQYDPTKKLPFVEWVDLRDIYIDPGASSPSVESARCIIFRKLMTIDELLDLKDSPGMTIPSKDILYSMANARPVTYGDMTIQHAESNRAVSYNPNADALLPTPADRFVEVLMYYSRSRIIWVLDRKWVAFNEKNDLGFLPFAFAPCYIVTGRFYAQGIPDVQEGNQRTSEALLNAYLDERTLNLNPPRVVKQDSLRMTPSVRANRPGLLLTSSEPTNDFIPQAPVMSQNVFADLGFFKSLASERTGISGAAVSGAPIRSNASRTKAGIAMQQQGPLSRISEIVDNIENYLILPMLYKMAKMMEFYAGETPEALPGYQNGQFVQVSSDSYKRPCRFKILAASKMLTREQMSQMFPFLAQYIFSGPFMAELQKSGKTVNFEEIFRAFQDATGTATAYEFIRPMNQQEQQAAAAPPPQVQAMMQAKQMDAQTRKEIMDKKAEVELTKAAMQHKSKEDVQAEQSAIQLLNLMAKAKAEAIEPPSAGPMSQE